MIALKNLNTKVMSRPHAENKKPKDKIIWYKIRIAHTKKWWKNSEKGANARITKKN